MKGFFSRLKGKLRGEADDFEGGEGENYVEIDSEPTHHAGKAKISVRPFVLEEFGDIKPVLDVLREGYTIALINIKPLKDRDLVELKRAVNKLKKTCDAVEGDIAGFGEDWIAITPSFA
ncbi:MAG: cell division protein SepF, partial [Nanoarchaeota archaeon]|nr:cell division protein SepF [Nanoarchaeota archaeon]